MPRLLFLLLACLLFPAAASAQWTANLASPAPDYLLAADKSRKLLYQIEQIGQVEQVEQVGQGSGTPAVTRQFACIHGRREGDKQKQGDLRTPEGVYFITHKIRQKLDYMEYGPHAFNLNYPNPADRLRRKTGGGIWLHSKGQDIDGLTTRGCLAIDRFEIEDLVPLLVPGTPVLVAEHFAGAPFPSQENTAPAPAPAAAPDPAFAAEPPAQSAALSSPTLLPAPLPVPDTQESPASPQAAQAAQQMPGQAPARATDPASDPASMPPARSTMAASQAPSSAPDNQESPAAPQAAQAAQQMSGQTPGQDPAQVADPDPAREQIMNRTLLWMVHREQRSEGLFDLYDNTNYPKGSREKLAALHKRLRADFRSEKELVLDRTSIRLLEGPGYWVSCFSKSFVRKNTATRGLLALYWLPGEDGLFRIIGEVWIRQ